MLAARVRTLPRRTRGLAHLSRVGFDPAFFCHSDAEAEPVFRGIMEGRPTPPSSRIREYRDQAKQTRQDAERTVTDPSLRRQLLDIANEFDQLADSVDVDHSE